MRSELAGSIQRHYDRLVPTVDMTQADLMVAANVGPEHAIHDKSRPFLEGTGPLQVHVRRPWWWTLVAFGAAVATAAFLYYSFEVWEFFWADNFVVFFIMLMSFFAVALAALAAVLSIPKRTEPRRPSHVLLGRITKLGYAANLGTRTSSVRFQSPQDGTTATAKITTSPGQLTKDQQVAVLYYGDSTIQLL